MTETLGEVFVSYSWDSEEHVKSVLKLSDRLRSDGIDCVLDQYESSPPEGWPRWMDRKIRDARFVLMICTETYYKRVMGDESPDTGLGVRWEGNLIYQHIYNAGTMNTKFVPVLMSRGDRKHVPTPLQGSTYYPIDTQDGYESLYARLLNRPRVQKPKLGKIRPLPKKEVKTDLSLYLSMPIDVELWNKARWISTGFMIAPDRPPILALGFLNGREAQEIFERWHHRYGARDTFEELRVSIVEGKIVGEDPGYSVHIGSDLENTIKRYEEAGLKIDPNGALFAMVSRINRMNPPPESKNLEMFKEAYRHFKSYFLIPATNKPDGSQFKPLLDLAIFKNSIQFRRVEDIGENDIDSVVIGTGSVKRDKTDYGRRRKKT